MAQQHADGCRNAHAVVCTSMCAVAGMMWVDTGQRHTLQTNHAFASTVRLGCSSRDCNHACFFDCRPRPALLCCAVVCAGQHACPGVPGLCHAPSRHRGSEVSGTAAPGSWQQQRQWPDGCGHRQGWPHHCQAQHQQHHRNVCIVFSMTLLP